MSAPAQNTRPAAFRTTTRTASFPATLPTASSSAFSMAVVKRLAGGAFSVMVAWRAAMERVTNSVDIRNLVRTMVTKSRSFRYPPSSVASWRGEGLMIAQRLADYAQILAYRRLPAAVVREAKRRVLDSLACALGGWEAAPCRIARRIAQSRPSRAGATLWGTSSRTSPDLAAFANGALVRYLDFNDTYLSREPAHPSDNLSAVLAVAETSRAPGKRVIEALVLA